MEKYINAIKKCVDYTIAILELNDAILQKNEAVRKQDFELASKFREKEKDLQNKLISLEELKEIRDELNK